MSALTHPDCVHLESAQGWYLLGNLKEANAALDLISPDQRIHPDVLEVRFSIYAKGNQWDACMDVATAMLEIAPERPSTWLNCSHTLYGMKHTQAAWETLNTVRHKWPRIPLISYNLACYSCVLGREEEALALLKEAVAKGGTEIKTMALSDPDLRPLQSRLAQI